MQSSEPDTNKDKRHWSRSRRLYFGLALLVAVAVFFAYLIYRSIDRQLTELALSRRESIAYLAGTTLSKEFERFVDVGRSLASRVRFSELTGAGKWSEAMAIMEGVPADFANIDQVALIDINGIVRGVSPSDPTQIGKNASDQDWFRQVTNLQKPTLRSEVMLIDNRLERRVVVAAPVQRDERGIVGILVVRTSVKRFLGWVSGLNLGAEGNLYVVDSQGRRLFESWESSQTSIAALNSTPVVGKALNGQLGVDIGIEPQGSTTIVAAYSPVAHGWGVVAQWPSAVVFEGRDDQLRRITISFALILLMALAAGQLLVQLSVERQKANTERAAKVVLEAKIAERTAQLKSANDELESYSYSIAHDLRAPLRAIDGFSQLLKASANDDIAGESKGFVERIHQNVVHMSRLIDELLEFSRISRTELKLQSVDMNKVAREAMATIAGMATVQLTIGQLPSALADVALIKQVWINLLDNAVKYSGQRKAPRLEISGQAQGRESVYCVIDNGVGFDMQYYDKLFKPFSRLHGAGEFSGTGVGLALVKRIIERHGGRVWAESLPDQGTKVYFTLKFAATP